MKSIRVLLLFMIFSIGLVAKSQTLNWHNLKKDQRNIVNVNAGIDYALTYGVGYGYQLKTKRPIVLNVEYSFPSGNNLFDDFKIKTGGQIRWLKSGNFYFSSKLQGVFRRYNNSYARLLNFGADLSTTAGYYKNKWFVAGELGFDKAIVTNFKHSDLYKANYPGVKDGWYEPSTGGNIYYGLQTGYSFKKNDIYLKVGKLVEQNLNTSPMLPFYVQIGLNLRIGKKQ
jgi:hypothetical protein